MVLVGIEINHEMFINANSSSYKELVGNWIPLPVLFEGLGIYHNFKDHSDLRASAAIDMVRSKVLGRNDLPTNNRKVYRTKKCGSLSTL